ncbi:hypothetical protein [Streptomyces lavendofoliae]|uniref:Uncharacterized protein n=1 Tax=Streptomyces lavendofoliae TaxID=67314 RepID=A0A918HTH1_9ACTN|nr:hypothetical protein [Streptomyces lavendofoliae]GGU25639.1 hypothetical protein GCM10010274_10360 [Streptomyces lavendofoliae]
MRHTPFGRTGLRALGFPHDLLREPGVRRSVHGDRGADIDERRTWRASRADTA